MAAGKQQKGLSLRQSTIAKEARALPLLMAIVAIPAGMLLRPDTLSSNRVGYSILASINSCSNFSDLSSLSFVEAFFAFVKLCLPVNLQTLEAWDVLLGIIGAVILVYFAFWVSRAPNIARGQSVLFAAIVALSSMYIYMLCKDVVQALIFIAAFALLKAFKDSNKAMVAVAALFALEGLMWRPYYLIVAVFVPVFYLALRKAKSGAVNGKMIIKFVLLVIVFAFLFAIVLKQVSPSDYAEIVSQHAEDRESFTANVAASGIKSFVDVTPSSPVYLFILNWVINTFRLLFPVELFTKSLYYWVFAAYQLAITISALRTLRNAKDYRVLLCLAVFFAFVFASGSFEPDFGSWVRHETAALPFLLVSLTGYTGKQPEQELKYEPEQGVAYDS